jgi:hypothetical protein
MIQNSFYQNWNTSCFLWNWNYTNTGRIKSQEILHESWKVLQNNACCAFQWRDAKPLNKYFLRVKFVLPTLILETPFYGMVPLASNIMLLLATSYWSYTLVKSNTLNASVQKHHNMLTVYDNVKNLRFEVRWIFNVVVVCTLILKQKVMKWVQSDNTVYTT